MISSFIRSFIFHILFTIVIGNASVKILQINLSNGTDNSKVSLNISDIINFIESNKPTVVLWSSNGKSVYDSFIEQIKYMKLNINILPLFFDDSRLCYVYPSNKIHANCYYKISYQSKLKFLVINTILWKSQSDKAEKQLSWLRENLQIANASNEYVIIVGYNPPGSLEGSNGLLNYDSLYNDKFVDLLLDYSKIIKACLFNNENIGTFRIISNKKENPILPMFISPLSSSKHIRVYSYNQITNELDNYVVYQSQTKNNWTEIYNCKRIYGLENMNATSWSKLAQSFSSINSSSFNMYQNYSLKSGLFKKDCNKFNSSNNKFNESKCIRCRSNCFIVYLKKHFLESCLKNCTSLIGVGYLDIGDDSEQNGFLFVFAVIAGFVIILVGIVLAVNKVYCIRRGRQGNIFLAPLTLNIQSEIVDDNQNLDLNVKVMSSKEDIDANSQIKNSNGFRRSNHEVEQTYNYIRM